jgi:hypothetical protein
VTSLALQVQGMLKQDPHCGHLFVFRGRRGDLVKVLWHDGQVILVPEGRNISTGRRSAQPMDCLMQYGYTHTCGVDCDRGRVWMCAH